MTAFKTRNIIQIDLRQSDAGGRHQIGTPAGFRSEQVAGFILECMAGFVGIRTRFKELVQTMTLQAALDEAAQRTYQEMNALTEQGFQEHEAWEMVRETYLFPLEEAALKAKNDRQPVAREAARMFNEIAREKSGALRGE